MNKQDIRDKLIANHKGFAELIMTLNDNDFILSANGKWTAGQQLDHIYRSVAALNKGLALPKIIIRLYVGRANRPSKDYDALVAKYKLRLEAGGRAMGRFVPKQVSTGEKIKLKEKLMNAVNGLDKKVDHYSESQLDYYILPHPLLGKLTIREMLYFTIYHVEHHRKMTLKNLGR